MIPLTLPLSSSLPLLRSSLPLSSLPVSSQGQIALKESQNWQQETKILQQEKDLLENEMNSLKNLFSEQSDEYQKKIHSLEDEVKLSLEHVNSAVKERDRTNTEITLILQEKAEMASREVTLTKRIQELVLEIEKVQNESKLKSEIEIIKLQRDSLFEMIKQQENTLLIQQKQSDVSLKMLHQRQAALDRYEQKYFHENDEINLLQENLTKLLSSEGEILQNEVMDGKKLLQMIERIKEKIHENNFILNENEKLENEKNEIYLKWKECEKKCEVMRREWNEGKEQLEDAKKLSIDWETRAHYWQQVAKKTTHIGGANTRGGGAGGGGGGQQQYDSSGILSPTSTAAAATGGGDGGGSGVPSMTSAMNSVDVNELKAENIRLQDLLTSTRSELANSQQELETSKSEMQKEFSSLWLAVEQLNKLDASKDKTIHELTIERDNAVADYKEVMKKYKAMKKEYDGLQSELQVSSPPPLLPWIDCATAPAPAPSPLI
jgi:chromosome segregation ATPase